MLEIWGDAGDSFSKWLGRWFWNFFRNEGGGGFLTPLRTMNLVILAKKSFNSKQGLSMLTAWPHPNSIDIAPQDLQHKGATRPATLFKKRHRWLWYRCLPVNFTEFLRTPLDNCFWRNSIREYWKWKCMHVQNWPTDRVRPAKWHFDSMEIIYLISNA